MATMYEELSHKRKQLQEEGKLPPWFTTGAYQLVKEKVLYNTDSLATTYNRIARCAAAHTDDPDKWAKSFYEIMWKGWLALSTPVISNMGTPKGMPVSCSGGYVEDSIDGFYSAYHEAAMLTKYGFGTSGYVGDIRPRGAGIKAGGKASGVLPVIKHFVQDMRDVAQGTSRRGAWAGYLPMDHKDYNEVVDYLEHHPDDLNLGWNISDEFISRLQDGDKDAQARYARSLKVKAVTGKGYYFFNDKVNNLSPDVYKDKGLKVLASNLCTEIALASDKDNTFTCVLSSLNLSKYDEWKDTDTVFIATVFLDCVASEFIKLSSNIPAMEKARRYTDCYRSLGLGTLGFHTYLQSKLIPFESFEAHMLNMAIFKHIREEADRASKWMGMQWGEPKGLQGYGRRNSHLLSIAPNTQSALICGGVSQGIEPVVANLYKQSTAAGEILRVNPTLLELAKQRGKWGDETISHLIGSDGSVQGFNWLTDHEKLVFKTAYEIDQHAIIRLAATRQQFIDQGQSINLFFDADEDEGYISSVHKEAFLNPNIKSLYYMRTKAGVKSSKGECLACEG